MKTKITSKNLKYTIKVNLEKKEFDKALKDAFNKIKKDVSIPGFRSGKITFDTFVSIKGKAPLLEEAINFGLNNTYPIIVTENNLKPISQPEIDIDEITEEKFSYTATVEVEPIAEIIGDYKKMKVEKFSDNVKDEEVEQRIEAELSKNIELTPVKRASKMGDTVIIDFDGYLGKEKFDGGKSENHSLKLGSKSFIDTFEDQLVGKKIGDDVTVKVKFPADYHSEELKGKAATFQVKINEIKEEKKPKFDDAFVKTLGLKKIGTVDEYKNDLISKIKDEKNAKKDSLIKSNLYKAIDKFASDSKNVKVEIPKKMIEMSVESQKNNLLNQFGGANVPLELVAKQFGLKGEKELIAEFEKNGKIEIQRRLTLEAIAAMEKITATDEDFNNKLKELSKMYNQKLADTKKMFKNSKLDIMDSIVVEKTIAHIEKILQK